MRSGLLQKCTYYPEDLLSWWNARLLVDQLLDLAKRQRLVLYALHTKLAFHWAFMHSCAHWAFSAPTAPAAPVHQQVPEPNSFVSQDAMCYSVLSPCGNPDTSFG